MKTNLLAIGGAGCWVAALLTAGAGFDRAADTGRQLLRPFVLPFLWRAVEDADHRGSPQEAFARGRTLCDWLDRWSDGYLWVAWRWANGGDATPGDDGSAHMQRLRAALAWLDEVRSDRPEVAVDVLVGTSFLVEMAARQDPGLAALMPSPTQGLGQSTEEVVDALLQAAEDAGAGAYVREQRLYAVPGLAAVFWRRGDQASALALLDGAIAQCPAIRNPDFAAEWRKTLQRLRAALAGDRSIDQGPLREDPRLQPLWPMLRAPK